MSTNANKSAGSSELARLGLPPRGLSRLQAAAYVGVSVGHFDGMVEQTLMPPAKRMGARRIWDRHQLDKAIEALPSDSGGGDDTDDVWSRAAV